MRHYSQILAEELSQRGPYTELVDQEFLENIFRSSPLHDIGKVGIPDSILLKPGRLTDEEYEVMKTHTVIGHKALLETMSHGYAGEFLKMAADIARWHHEKWNGEGYPDGLAGHDIPLSARIVALADVFDALTSQRVYKAAWEPDRARKLIEEESGRHFDPANAEAFLNRWSDVLDVYTSLTIPVDHSTEADATKANTAPEEAACV